MQSLKEKDEAYQNSYVHNSVDDNIDSGKKKESSLNITHVLSEIRAAYKNKKKKMGSRHLNNSHLHQLKFNPDSFNYKQFKDTFKRNR